MGGVSVSALGDAFEGENMTRTPYHGIWTFSHGKHIPRHRQAGFAINFSKNKRFGNPGHPGVHAPEACDSFMAV